MMVQEFVSIDKDLQTVQDITDVNIIILIYLFIKHVLFILVYLYKYNMHVSTTDCTEGGGLTREHCTFIYQIITCICKMLKCS